KTIARLKDLEVLHGVGSCHFPAHRAGHFAYQLYGQHAFESCPAECQSGCYHGIMEEFFVEEGTTDAVNKIQNLCDVISNSFFKQQCVHGLGHGIMAWTDYNLPEALAICDSLKYSHEEDTADSCATGVFMENIVGAIVKDPTRDKGNANLA